MDSITASPNPVAPGNPHGHYRAGATAWRDTDGEIQVRGPLVVQCSCQGPHTDQVTVEAKVERAEGLTAWVVTANAPDGLTAGALAQGAARNLAPLLTGVPGPTG